jgi:hypothetical protein
MKYVGIAVLATVIAVMCYMSATAPPSFEKWAQDAPLEKVIIKPGQTVQGLMKDRVPEGILVGGDISYITKIIGTRQGKKLGSVSAWEEILLPVPYETWRPY